MSSDDNLRGWALTEEPEVREVIQSAARKVGEKLGHLRSHYDSTDAEHKWVGSDVEQEAMILVATKADLQAAADRPRLLYRALVNDLMDFFETEVRRASKSVSYSGIDGGLTVIEETDAYITVEAPGGNYTRESIEEILPAIWDDSYCYGLDRRANVPDPDMPRSRANPAHGNNLAAAIADIRSAWRRADLAIEERRALILSHGLGWTQRQAAYNQGVSQKTVSLRVQNGIAKMLAHLNGGEWFEMEEQTEEAAA